MNPQFHDEFVALCALYYSGEISEEEWALLQIHMAYCDSCHEQFQQYGKIASEVIPAMAAAAAPIEMPRKAAFNIDAAEQELMSRLDALPVVQKAGETHKSSRKIQIGLIAACVALFACALGAYLIHSWTPASMDVPAQVASQTTKPEVPVVVTRDTKTSQVVADLQQQLATSEQKLRQSSAALSSAQKRIETEQAAHQQLSDERAALSTQLSAAQTEVQSLRDRLASATSDSTQTSHLASLEATVHELRTALDEKDLALQDKERMLELDKDFLAHDRDIRDLIGARNLYIADITDTNEDGKAAKQFGRIFYTKDRSLVFYGFDLDSQAGRRKDVSFQVWGSGSDRQTPVSLGLFYQDETHKRWVLRCNDEKTLTRLDMVFVTVEPTGGSSRPTGKQLLRAYLQIHPNHP